MVMDQYNVIMLQEWHETWEIALLKLSFYRFRKCFLCVWRYRAGTTEQTFLVQGKTIAQQRPRSILYEHFSSRDDNFVILLSFPEWKISCLAPYAMFSVTNCLSGARKLWGFWSITCLPIRLRIEIKKPVIMLSSLHWYLVDDFEWTVARVGVELFIFHPPWCGQEKLEVLCCNRGIYFPKLTVLNTLTRRHGESASNQGVASLR